MSRGLGDVYKRQVLIRTGKLSGVITGEPPSFRTGLPAIVRVPSGAMAICAFLVYPTLPFFISTAKKFSSEGNTSNGRPVCCLRTTHYFRSLMNPTPCASWCEDLEDFEPSSCSINFERVAKERILKILCTHARTPADRTDGQGHVHM